MILSERITIMLAEDHAAVRQSLRALLNAEPGFLIVGEAKNGSDAVAMARKLRPEVILMDISMPLLNGLEATRQVLAAKIPSKVIILSAYNDEEYIERAKAVGAVGFLAKQMFAETLTWTVREVASGRRLFNPVAPETPLRTVEIPRMYKRPPGARNSRLTSLESEVLQMAADGSPNRRIAQQLHISIKLVEQHLADLVGKLNLPIVPSLAEYAAALGIVENSVVLKIT
jgi:DNA-binding NarL/FixJ family response regulator